MTFLENYPLLESFVTGLVSGFLVSIPVGPINVTIIHEGGARGFRWGFLIGAGSVLMESIYCALGFAGFSGFFTSKVAVAILQIASFALMSYLGCKYLFARKVNATSPSAARVEERFHPHTAFWTGFVRALGYPGVLLLWIALSATFLAHEWVDPNWTSKSLCVSGVAAGLRCARAGGIAARLSGNDHEPHPPAPRRWRVHPPLPRQDLRDQGLRQHPRR